MTKAREAIRRRKGEAALKERLLDERPQKRAAMNATMAKRLAVGLHHEPDIAKAARLVGIDIAEKDLKPLADYARRQFKGLIEGRAEDRLREVTLGIDLGIFKLQETIVQAETPYQAGGAVKVLRELYEALGGSDRPVYSEVTLVVKGLDG